MSKLDLFNNFPNVNRQDWQSLVEKGLKGAAIESLIKTTDDALTRGPLFTQDDRPDAVAPLARSATPLLDGRPWHIAAIARQSDINLANQQILEDLSGGASAVRLTLGTNGIKAQSHNDIKRLFDKVHTNLIPIIIAPNNDIENQHLFHAYHNTHLYLGLGPKTDGLNELLQNCPKTWQLITIRASRVHNTGGTDAQELAYFAASAAYAFRHLGKNAARHIGVELTTDQDGHMSIAKLRAARRIYARIADSFGVDNAPLCLHAVSSNRMMQSTDPWTNMLRTMSAGFGAVIGGADFISLRPFTDAHDIQDTRETTPFSCRIARNMQLMMMEESHLGQVQDAAFGSYFHERMTESLAQAAWTEFQQIEQDGGIDNIGPFKARVKTAKDIRLQKNTPILGVNLHPIDKNSSAFRDTKIKGPQS
ncbi:MAG: methylmalonyl-CoA mutase family protein [Litorimonas sp.]